MFDKELIKSVYENYSARVVAARKMLGRPMMLCEKILYAHLYDQAEMREFARGQDYVNFAPDRVAMQDATAQMALLQFMNAGKEQSAVPASIHCDHLIVADNGAQSDLSTAEDTNREVYDFLHSVASKYGIGFWKPGAGIIHQVVLENYAFPGGMIIGTDSHTPNAGGLGMIAIGVGGADAVDVMVGMPWELKMPEVIGVKLTGKLSGWAAPKDVILKLAGILTVKGATNAIIEYFGGGTASLSATGKATICNMGAEVGATTSIFPYDKHIGKYLHLTGRGWVAECAEAMQKDLCADKGAERYYNRVIEINLSELEPYLNGPFTPDLAHAISAFGKAVIENNYPRKMECGLIGSCTNSSYEDLGRAASVARQALEQDIEVKADFLINPGSQQVYDTAERDGIMQSFRDIGGVIMANACGPCIGQWSRHIDDPKRANSIVTSFNRNFSKRADGNPNTYAFVASPEIVTALTIAGDLTFNPITDTLLNREGKAVKLLPPQADQLPKRGMQKGDNGYLAPDGKAQVVINPASQRLQKLTPFKPFNASDFMHIPLLIKAQGKCTTDHISMAGVWLKYRGHLENISDNLLMGAVNVFNGETNSVLNQLDGGYAAVSAVAKAYKQKGISSIVVAEENYGEGSSREHAALEPRFLYVKAVLVKSFARIHETNLKKQGMLALTFDNKEDYEKIQETDKFSLPDVADIAPGKKLTVRIEHADGTCDVIKAKHTYNEQQINWLKAGSALNVN